MITAFELSASIDRLIISKELDTKQSKCFELFQNNHRCIIAGEDAAVAFDYL